MQISPPVVNLHVGTIWKLCAVVVIPMVGTPKMCMHRLVHGQPEANLFDQYNDTIIMINYSIYTLPVQEIRLLFVQ